MGWKLLDGACRFSRETSGFRIVHYYKEEYSVVEIETRIESPSITRSLAKLGDYKSVTTLHHSNVEMR